MVFRIFAGIQGNSECLSFPVDESVLMDLKALLVEAKQKVPPVLQVLQTGEETMLDIGGEFKLISYSVITLCFLYKCSSNTIILRLTVASFLKYMVVVVSQERGAVHFVVVWVIVSQTVQNWRPCRRSRSPTSGGKTTWLIVQWTSKCFSFEGRSSKAKRNSLLRKTVCVMSLNKGSVLLSSAKFSLEVRQRKSIAQLFFFNFTLSCPTLSAFVTYIFDTLIVNKTSIPAVISYSTSC